MMKRRIRRLLIQALMGSGKAYRRLGLAFAGGNREERILAGLCLQKSMEMGDEYSFFIYHGYYSKGQQVIDDSSYQAMCHAYKETVNLTERKILRLYLKMGTKRQRRLFLSDSSLTEADHRRKYFNNTKKR